MSGDPSNPDVLVRSWGPGRDGSEVRFLTVHGAAHAWMGGRTPVPGRHRVPYHRLDASAAIWEFLAAHPRP